MRKTLVVALVVAASALAAGCGGDDDEAAPTTTQAAGAGCTKDSLPTKTPGKLTIATDNPVFPPWFEGPKKDEPWDPTTTPTKKGYEAEVAYGIARELGFSDAEVEWKVVPFAQVFRPGPKDFDFDINEASYSAERAKAVDFSDSYYEVEQAVVGVEGTPIADAKSLAELRKHKLGVAIGTTSYDTIVKVVKPDADPAVYDTNNDAISGLKAKQIEGIVTDYPTSLYMSAVQVDDGTVVGRLPQVQGNPEHFGLVFEKGSDLVDCVNDAIATLRRNGTLDRLEQQWVSGAAPPVLR